MHGANCKQDCYIIKLMSTKRDTIITQLNAVGVSPDESHIYLALIEGRGDTALSLARATGFRRTKVYRLLESLIAHKLVVTKLGGRGSRFVATPIDQLDFLLQDREQELENLKASLPKLKSQLSELTLRGSTPKSQVMYYHGLDGLKQITHNSLRAKGELLTYELSSMNAFFSRKEAEEFRHKFVERKIKIRTLTNATHLEAWTNVTEMVEEYWEIRHLSPGDKPFQFEILIYNDVYCMYRYTGADIFCVEIHSQELADMQRQLFEYLWAGAKRFKVLDKRGTAQVVV